MVNFTLLNLMKIQIENHEGRLRLRWHDGDKRQTLAADRTAVTLQG
jgi:hypothetical protein